MLAKIRTHVADSQATIRIAGIGMSLDESPERSSVPAVPASILFKDGPGVASRVKLQREYEITIDQGTVRVQGDGLTKGGDGLFELALVFQGHAEIVVSLGIIGPDCDRP